MNHDFSISNAPRATNKKSFVKKFWGRIYKNSLIFLLSKFSLFLICKKFSGGDPKLTDFLSQARGVFWCWSPGPDLWSLECFSHSCWHLDGLQSKYFLAFFLNLISLKVSISLLRLLSSATWADAIATKARLSPLLPSGRRFATICSRLFSSSRLPQSARILEEGVFHLRLEQM